MSFPDTIRSMILPLLKVRRLDCQVDEKKGEIRSTLPLKPSNMPPADITFKLYDSMYLIYITYAPECPAAARPEMRKLLSRINYDLPFGSFAMNERTGKVRLRCTIDCEDCLPSPNGIYQTFSRASHFMYKYAEAILHIIKGGNSDDAYELSQGLPLKKLMEQLEQLIGNTSEE